MTENLHLKTEKRVERARKLAIQVYFYLNLIVFIYGLINLYCGLSYSAYNAFILVGALCIGMYLFVVKNKYFIGNLITFISLVVYIAVSIYLEGLMSGHHLYYLTMIFGIPLLVHRGENFNTQSLFCYSVIISAIVIMAFVSPMYSEVYNMPVNLTHSKLAVNSIISFVIIVMFSVLTIHFAKQYIKTIIFQKKKAEDEKDSRTRVLSNLGHELRTQINSINGVTQLILEDHKKMSLENACKTESYPEILDYCNNKMLSLVNDMLDLHKIEVDKFELFLESKDLYSILENITLPFKNQAQQKGLKLLNRIDERIKNVYTRVDGTRLTQVVHNLLANAIKYTNTGAVEFSATVIHINDSNIEIRFSITDTGIGISQENITKIFESFQQVKRENKPIYGGTGLGLSLCKTIVEKMGSSIKVNSAIDKGSDFYFTVNFDRVDETEILSITTTNDFDTQFLKDTTILVAEDNKVSMLYISKLLSNYNVNVLKASNGLEAVDAVEKHSNLDLILLDLEMPEMNGFEAIKHIKNINSNTNVIAFTANVPDQKLIQKLKHLQFDDILSKPFKKEQLVLALKRNIREITQQKIA